MAQNPSHGYVVALLSEDEFTAEIVEPIFAEVAYEIPYEDRKQSLNISHIVGTWKQLMRSGVAHTWAGIVGGKTVGLLGALFMREFFTGNLMAMEQFWFVQKSHRRSGIGLKLFAEFETEALKRGATTLWVGSNFCHDPALMERLYRRKGYRHWGATFRKVV